MNVPVPKAPRSFRVYAGAFAIVLGLQAAWLLSAEISRPDLPFFPTGKSEIDDAASQRSRAAAAADIGWLRGDLWAEYALTADSNSLSGVGPQSMADKGEPVSAKALAAAPYDARLWLLLFRLNAQSGWKDDNTLAQLKMAYYTAPNDARLFAARLQSAMQPQAAGDDELRPLVAHEISAIVTRKPELKPVIADAYRTTNAAGQRLIEEQLTSFDRGFLAELQTPKR
jgi:hypothetical protein